MDNGPPYELVQSESLDESMSYCVDCGNVMVFHPGRTCPACHLNERINDLEDRIDQLEAADD